MAHSVQLAVYDLSMGMARQLSMGILGQQIDGIWHTGIVVYGREYFFGGGIQNLPHNSFVASYGIQPTRMIDLGATDIDRPTFEAFLREISHQFTTETYDLINHNCNHFTNTCAEFLLGRGIPDDILNLPQRVFATPIGAMLRPMFEQIQNSARAAPGAAMDPFAAGAGAMFGGTSMQQAGYQQPVATPSISTATVAAPVAQPPQVQHQHNQPMTRDQAMQALREVLASHNKPLLSAESGASGSIISKMQTAAASRLPEARQQLFTPLADAVANNREFSDGIALLHELLPFAEVSRSHIFFVGRLLLLHEVVWAEATRAHARGLVDAAIQLVSENSAQTTPGTIVMALALCANALAAFVRDKIVSTPDTMSAMTDAAAAALHHARDEVRVMASALLANLALATTTTPDGDGHIMMLCGAMENLATEQNETVKFRRLLSVGRLVEKSPDSVIELMRDLEFGGLLREVREISTGGTPLHAITHALCCLLA